MNQPDPTPESATRKKLGLLLRVAMFAFLEVAGLTILGPLMYPIGGYFVSAALSTFAAAAIANALAMRVYERGQLADVGLGWTRASGRHLLLGFAGGVWGALFVLVPPLMLKLAYLRPDMEWKGGFGTFLFVAVVLLFGAIGEELLFRGYGFQLLLGTVGRFATILPMGVLFGVAHSNNQSANHLGLVNTVLWGILFGIAFLRSRDLWLPIGLHYGWNLTLPMFGVNLSGFTMNVTGYSMHWRIADLWSGGEYGPEGGLLTTASVLILLAALGKAPVERQVSFLFQPDDEIEA